ncbi:hypothetical protein PsorP6_016339 [Peronosclerospora sorghi]|uniref:Uncharacterized protein n=1 Tax=Peronosclerospora sorghi TaxID=230839 RepID=A0ACC0VQX5_9STRA|nr:hypothetical protein PsorP6_016339 [Peronosclerospora sorghi]
MCLVKGPLSKEDIAEADLAVPHVRLEEYMVAYADALIFIRDQGLFVIDSLEAPPEPDVGNIVTSIANLFAGLYSGIKGVLAVRHSENIGSSAPIPPYTQRLQRAGWTQVQIDQVEQDHRDLLSAYRGEPVFKNALDNCSDANTGFNDDWGLCIGRFDYLRDFLGGLDPMLPNTATVESDFSLIGYEKDEYRNSLTDFSLEGILHAKQLDTLRALLSKQ